MEHKKEGDEKQGRGSERGETAYGKVKVKVNEVERERQWRGKKGHVRQGRESEESEHKNGGKEGPYGERETGCQTQHKGFQQGRNGKPQGQDEDLCDEQDQGGSGGKEKQRNTHDNHSRGEKGRAQCVDGEGSYGQHPRKDGRGTEEDRDDEGQRSLEKGYEVSR